VEALEAVRDLLALLDPLELDVEFDHPHPLLRQAFFRLQGVSEFLLVDLWV
jgi:hypothetical protein